MSGAVGLADENCAHFRYAPIGRLLSDRGSRPPMTESGYRVPSGYSNPALRMPSRNFAMGAGV
jgi:hypothetical protein